MPSCSYTEDLLVEQPAIRLLAKLGWQTASGMEETFGPDGLLGRESRSETILTQRLRAALAKLNPGTSAGVLDDAMDVLVRDRSSMSLAAANREIWTLLREGIEVAAPDPERGGRMPARVRAMDWDRPEENDFLLVSQFEVAGRYGVRRPDLVGFVNGLPLVVAELKRPGVPVRAAFDDNLVRYKEQIPALFRCNALLVASSGDESRVGSLTADWDRFFEWKRVESEEEPRRASLEVLLRGVCAPARLLDLMESFTLFSDRRGSGSPAKILGQNHQVVGVNSALAAVLEARRQGHGRGGVFWQTQGSGKSLSMLFLAQKALRKIPGNWTFVVVTDRVELDSQIAATFKEFGAASAAESCHADSGARLRELLRGNHRYVFALVQKFQTPEMLCDRSDVIVLADEAHRSQYDVLALNMRAALPNALFLAFTGTPLIAGEERPREVFGDYVSIYDFQQSIEDGATVPLFYENRTPELQLANPDLDEEVWRLIEEAELGHEQEERLERELVRQRHLLVRDDRLEAVAQDLVRHFLDRGFQGKAMAVSVDKATALRMHDKVRKFWAAETERVREALERKPCPCETELRQRLGLLESVDMAVVVSPSPNETERMRALGLDIAPHRRRMNEDRTGLDERFKDPGDPLRLVFVCSMWLTGLDAPCCSTIYLDKPMRNHALMQAIARANRVFPGKHSGMVVDYANVLASLEQALAIYGAGRDGRSPVRDKAALAAELRAAVQAASRFCAGCGVDLAGIDGLEPGSMERLQAVTDAVEALVSPALRREELLAHQRRVDALLRALKPDRTALELAGRAACLATVAAAIRARLHPGPLDVSQVMASIGVLLDESILGMEIRQQGPQPLDLSQLDLEGLSRRFRQSVRRKSCLETLAAALRAQIRQMVRRNRTRVDFAERFEALIESYNAGSRSVEALFEELVQLSCDLSSEQQRHVREQMSEEELAVFDVLVRSAPELSPEEREKAKKVARTLLARLKELLVLGWQQKSAARSRLKLAIEDVLDEGLPPAYTQERYRHACAALFKHVCESCSEQDVDRLAMAEPC